MEGKNEENSRPTIHFAFTLLQTLKTPMKHSWNASSAATGSPWLIAETDRLIIREFSQDDPLEPASAEDADGTIFLIGTSARNTGNTSTALPSAVCGRWNAARTVCWLERRG